MAGELTTDNFDKYNSLIKDHSQKLKENNIQERIFARDHTVWNDDPAEISNRLGWLDSPRKMQSRVSEILDFVNDLDSGEIKNVLLMGMGGSSLAPEFFGNVRNENKPRFNFHVIDSTNPAVVKKYQDKLHPSETLYIASSKSGGTVETLSLLKFFFNFARERSGEKEFGRHFVAITDPGSKLEKTGRDYSFRKIFLNDSDIGGRFSVLSYFGMVPAALSGWDISLLLDRARQMAEKCRRNDDNPGFLLGILTGCLALKNINKPTIILPESYRLFGDWIEQLVAESTGKNGKGILPIITAGSPEISDYTKDRYLIYLKISGDHRSDEGYGKALKANIPLIRITLEDLYDFGGQFFAWEFATAIAGHIMGIHPFNQPDVEAAKSAAREMVDIYNHKGKLPEPGITKIDDNIELYETSLGDSLDHVLKRFFKEAENMPGSYIYIQAFLNPTKVIMSTLNDFRDKLEKNLGLPVSVGIGPRYLHSTGQLHKGDAGRGFFIQLLENYEPELIIPDDLDSPDGSISFGTLIKAQCIGDRKALLESKRNLLSVRFTADTNTGLMKLISLL